MRFYGTVIVSVLAALATNMLLDMYTDLAMVLRWIVAAAVAMLTTMALHSILKRRSRRGQSASTPDK
ncbi:hypothetical protein [Humidisolicoccus flavus]|uniref:hypothetical protein n=1 Tax=Humidisolicoccus flavus TaxID=3111414 RepID=UPI003247C452